MTRLNSKKIVEENQNKDPSSITSLVLTQKALTDVSCLSEFKNLERLDLAFNNLSSLEGLSSCINLKWLSVVQNKLESLKGIERLSKLQVLNAGKNKLKSMTEVTHLISVRALILNDNEISTICKLDQKELNTLVLSRNPIRKIGDSLVKAKAITKLSLSHCQLENIGSSFKSLADLKEVRLAHNEITIVPSELALNTRLQNLDLGNNSISNWSALKALSSFNCLKNLNLQGNPIAENDTLAKKVKKLVPNLQIYNSRPIERSKANERNSKKDVKSSVVDNSSPSKASDLKDLNEEQREVPRNEKTSKKRIFSEEEDDPFINEKDTNMEKDELKKKKSKVNKLPAKDISSSNKGEIEAEDRLKRKNSKKVKENTVDMIDDGETSFMDLITSSSRDPEERKTEEETIRAKKSVGEALVTFPVNKKKVKGVPTGLAALQLLSSPAEVGMGGHSSWDA
ncbi:hypothetical protein C5167_002758 [Papaver somniferum]|uniref:Protein phosphatase 1 regulatory subunit 7 n=1 Tax=Papaver somniferum TaxID=3469 RepID=A0A4Y7L2B9_PAPSO|nr:protein phosphatase 1 regulatory subunit 7-like isoform X1 [Papaver somniferum]RZC78578.1 hypothetical protein C5167_002758 [Papaver somniferum]